MITEVQVSKEVFRLPASKSDEIAGCGCTISHVIPSVSHHTHYNKHLESYSAFL
jgi:hypothetical protein